MPAQHAPAYDPLASAAAAQDASSLPADAVARLGTLICLLLIESFFARALDLSLATRAEMQPALPQMAANEHRASAGQSERFLEAVAYSMRSSARVGDSIGRVSVCEL